MADNPNDAATDTPYAAIGGDAQLRRMVDRFYDLMDETPAFERIRRLHPADLAGSREKLYLFLSGYLGGPPLYQERIGHPMLRARHLPFPIGVEERDQWMACMIMAMEDVGIDVALRDGLAQAFFRTADWMRNRAEAGGGQ
jgi:hemoglobin